MPEPADALRSLRDIRQQIAEARAAPPQTPATEGIPSEGQQLARILVTPQGGVSLEYPQDRIFDVQRAMTLLLLKVQQDILMAAVDKRLGSAAERRVWTPGETK